MGEQEESRTIDIAYAKGQSGTAKIRYNWRSAAKGGRPWTASFYSPRGNQIGGEILDIAGTGSLGEEDWPKAYDAAQGLAIEGQAPVAGWVMGDRFEIPASAGLPKLDTGVFEVDHVWTRSAKRDDGTIYARAVTPTGKVRSGKNAYRTFGVKKMKRLAKRVGKGVKPGKEKKTRAVFSGCVDTFDGMRTFLKSVKVGDVIQVRLIEGNWGSAPYDRKGRTRKYDVTETSFRDGNAYVAITNQQLRSAARSVHLNHIETQTVPFKKVNELDATRRARVMRGYPRVTAHIGSKWYTITGLSRGKVVEAKKVPTKKRQYGKHATIPRNTKLYRAVFDSATHLRAREYDDMGDRNYDTTSKAVLADVKHLAGMGHLYYRGPGEGYVYYFHSNSSVSITAPDVDVLEAGFAKPKKKAAKKTAKRRADRKPRALKRRGKVVRKWTADGSSWEVRDTRETGVTYGTGSMAFAVWKDDRIDRMVTADEAWSLGQAAANERPAKKAAKSRPKASGATYTIEAQVAGTWSQKKRTGTYKDVAKARLRVERFKTPWRIVEHRDGKRRIVAKSNGNGGKKHVARISQLKAAKKAGRGGAFLERVLKEENKRLSAALRGI